MVNRIYVEKKPAYAVEAKQLLQQLQELVGISEITSLRIIHRYDVEGIDIALFDTAVKTVFSEPPVDDVYEHLPQAPFRFAVSYLPGQFDQRADSAAACISLISQGQRPIVRTAKIYMIEASITEQQREMIKHYIINPVESEEVSLDRFSSLASNYPIPEDVLVFHNFLDLNKEGLDSFLAEYSLAMDLEDITLCQDYFRREGRAPTITEIRMLDTYWSDHCRHTTFGTQLQDITIEDKQARESYELYLDLRKSLGRQEKPITLMDMATIGARALKATGHLNDLDESEEINACSVKVSVDVDGKDEDWLLLFKNETHNHPTEIEPFGGAATCIGGAIRDPLSGRGYVYQAMRITGAGNPLAPIEQTLPGKLPQRKLTQTAAAGYSSYGNQIGLATGYVREIYHQGYTAKRMEIGAVMGAVPLRQVRRETPRGGDRVILLGGRTGRDGCGGATGSSKAHKLESLEVCGAEVQKGNAPVERKLQRLFRNPKVTELILRCNDFGAGGVSVAVGELADGLIIDLDLIPKKYDGLDGTELAISESQERMAVVVEEKDVAAFIELAETENLEATVIAVITEEKRLKMNWRGKEIVNISREFLNSNGAPKHASAYIPKLPTPQLPHREGTLLHRLASRMSDLNYCCQKGLAEQFDASIGAGSVLMPFGGTYQMTPTQGMVAKLPVQGSTRSISGMAYGFDPFISEQNPYQGAYLAVVSSVAKLIAMGFSVKYMYLTFQEYFERLYDDATRWGKPVSALLGALQAQLDFKLAAIGGKDSMSGSFEHLDVPPTLVSFAVAHDKLNNVISPEFKKSDEYIYFITPDKSKEKPYVEALMQAQSIIEQGNITAAYACTQGGIAEALFQMSIGNHIGVLLTNDVDIFAPATGSFILSSKSELSEGICIGKTTKQYVFATARESVDLCIVERAYIEALEPVFPWRGEGQGSVKEIDVTEFKHEKRVHVSQKAQPRVLIPVFSGTNCEYDTANAFEQAGAQANIMVVRDLTPAAVAESAAALAKAIDESQIVMLPGGFSGGDEPEGSAKLIAAFFRGMAVKDAVHRLLKQRDGLMLGICNGFQALIKLGLLPYGEISDLTEDSPSLSFNVIGRHQSMMVQTKIVSTRSPWLSEEACGNIHTIPVSHGEGKFIASESLLFDMERKGMIATQYVDLSSKPSMDMRYNPNGSVWAIEGISSEDGRIFGKMGHSERRGEGLYQNIHGNYNQKIFTGGVNYFL